MRIFENQEAQQHYHKLSQRLKEPKRILFGVACKRAYEAKVTAIEQFPTYLLTKQDIDRILALFLQ